MPRKGPFFYSQTSRSAMCDAPRALDSAHTTEAGIQ